MPDREKVMRGLECCAGQRCSECPYHNGTECVDALTPDALALLKDSVSIELFLEVLRKYEVAELGMISEYSCDTKAAEANLKKEIEKIKKKAGDISG